MFWAYALAQQLKAFQASRYAELTAQEELIFPPLPDRKTSMAYYTSKDAAFVEHAKRHNPTCIEFYTTQH